MVAGLPLISDFFTIAHLNGDTDGISLSVLVLRQMPGSDNGDWLLVALLTVLSQIPV